MTCTKNSLLLFFRPCILCSEHKPYPFCLLIYLASFWGGTHAKDSKEFSFVYITQ